MCFFKKFLNDAEKFEKCVKKSQFRRFDFLDFLQKFLFKSKVFQGEAKQKKKQKYRIALEKSNLQTTLFLPPILKISRPSLGQLPALSRRERWRLGNSSRSPILNVEVENTNSIDLFYIKISWVKKRPISSSELKPPSRFVRNFLTIKIFKKFYFKF